MISLGLTHAEQLAYHEALFSSHQIRTSITIRDRDEKVISTVRGNEWLLGGSVQVDATQSPHRQLEVEILKPRKGNSWLPFVPGDAAIYADNFISAKYGVFVDSLDMWVDCPVFWGPLRTVKDNGDTFSVTAAGKDVLQMAPHLLWIPITIPKGTKRTDGIRTILESNGEAKFNIPDLNSKVGATWSLDRHAEPLVYVRSLAGGMHRQFFYDGGGYARVRQIPENRVFTFREGDAARPLAGQGLAAKPNSGYDIEKTRNMIEVLGPETKGKGAPPRIRAVAIAPEYHPLSPFSLRRNGKLRRMIEVIDTDLTMAERPPGLGGSRPIVTEQEKADAIANYELEQGLRLAVDISYETFVVPHLEEFDMVAVELNNTFVEHPMLKWTIPLVADERMSIGTNKRVSVKRWIKRTR